MFEQYGYFFFVQIVIYYCIVLNEFINKVKVCVGNEIDCNICLYEEKWVW